LKSPFIEKHFLARLKNKSLAHSNNHEIEMKLNRNIANEPSRPSDHCSRERGSQEKKTGNEFQIRLVDSIESNLMDWQPSPGRSV
jgi:hypothetical protein